MTEIGRYNLLWNQLMGHNYLSVLECGDWISQIKEINRIAEIYNLPKWEPEKKP